MSKLETPQSTLSATPGFYIVEPVTEGNKIVDAVLMPIIGWALHEGVVYPVSIFEVCENSDYPILTPNGTVFDCFQASYDNIQDWMTCKNADI